MSSTLVQEYHQIEDRQILCDMLAIVILDSKRCPRLSLLREFILSKKQWALKLEGRKPKIQNLLSLLDERIRKRGSGDGLHCNCLTNQSASILSKS